MVHEVVADLATAQHEHGEAAGGVRVAYERQERYPGNLLQQIKRQHLETATVTRHAHQTIVRQRGQNAATQIQLVESISHGRQDLTVQTTRLLYRLKT